MRRARIREGALWGAKIVSTFPEWAGLQAKPNFRHPQFAFTDAPPVPPVRILPGETKDQCSGGRLEWWPSWLRMRVRPATGDQLAVPAQQRVRSHQETRPGRARQRAAQRRQQRSIGPRQPWPSRLPPQNSQLVPQHKNLQFLRSARPPQQPHQREQVPHDEIHKRPEQSALPRPRQERRTYRARHPGEPRTSLRTLRVPKLASWLQIADFSSRAPSFGTRHASSEEI